MVYNDKNKRASADLLSEIITRMFKLRNHLIANKKDDPEFTQYIELLESNFNLLNVHASTRSVTTRLISVFSASSVVNSILYSFTRNGLNVIFSLDEGRINSYVGVSNLGKAIVFSLFVIY
jgi:hypothetical protein